MTPFPRFAWRAAALVWLAGMTTGLRADETNSPGSAPSPATNQTAPTPAPSWVKSPLLSTNLPSAFQQNHQEIIPLFPPTPFLSEQPGLSLRPGPAPGNEFRETTPFGPVAVPQPFLFFGPIGRPDEFAAHLLVVYNANDPNSKSLAKYYALRRNIPAERILPISCSTNEEINRTQYTETIREPIISYLSKKNWMTRRSQQVHINGRTFDLLVATHNDIWAIVLMRGVPLKIAASSADDESLEREPELQTNAAAVDSELALLPVFGLPNSGYVPNPFFDVNANGLVRVGPELADNLILVTRLDGPTPDDVRRMIDDSIYAENNRLAGLSVIDSRGFTDVKNNYTQGDTWLRKARDLLTMDGFSVKFDDKPDLIPASDPCNHVALYMGWYGPSAEGPWVTPPSRFIPGAIAYHLHSFSASTVRSRSSNWVGPLIDHGADATLGTVYEPYLALTPHMDIFTKRLLDGDYFAEAAYASQRGLSWMVTVIGDPLYRPFRQPLPTILPQANAVESEHDDWLLLQQVQRSFARDQLIANTDTLEHSLNLPGTGAIVQEGLGDLLEKLTEPAAGPAAEEAYKKAMVMETLPIDRIRVGLKLAQHYVNHVQDEQAQAELKILWELYPTEAQRFGVTNPLAPTAVQPVSSAHGSE